MKIDKIVIITSENRDAVRIEIYFDGRYGCWTELSGDQIFIHASVQDAIDKRIRSLFHPDAADEIMKQVNRHYAGLVS